MNVTTDSKEHAPHLSSGPQRRVSVAGRMRVAARRLRADTFDRVRAAGFDDLTDAQLVIFRYEGVDGRQPSEIAHSTGLSKQSVNDTLRHLEDRGYVTRQPHPTDGRARIIRLTARGRRLDQTIVATGYVIDAIWRNHIGEPAWTAFSEVLDRLVGDDPPADLPVDTGP